MNYWAFFAILMTVVAAGSGAVTLTRKMAKNWASGAVMQFALAFFFAMRALSEMVARSLFWDDIQLAGALLYGGLVIWALVLRSTNRQADGHDRSTA